MSEKKNEEGTSALDAVCLKYVRQTLCIEPCEGEAFLISTHISGLTSAEQTEEADRIQEARALGQSKVLTEAIRAGVLECLLGQEELRRPVHELPRGHITRLSFEEYTRANVVACERCGKLVKNRRGPEFCGNCEDVRADSDVKEPGLPVLPDETTEAHLRWLETGEGEPWGNTIDAGIPAELVGLFDAVDEMDRWVKDDFDYRGRRLMVDKLVAARNEALKVLMMGDRPQGDRKQETAHEPFIEARGDVYEEIAAAFGAKSPNEIPEWAKKVGKDLFVSVPKEEFEKLPRPSIEEIQRALEDRNPYREPVPTAPMGADTEKKKPALSVEEVRVLRAHANAKADSTATSPAEVCDRLEYLGLLTSQGDVTASGMAALIRELPVVSEEKVDTKAIADDWARNLLGPESGEAMRCYMRAEKDLRLCRALYRWHLRVADKLLEIILAGGITPSLPGFGPKRKDR